MNSVSSPFFTLYIRNTATKISQNVFTGTRGYSPVVMWLELKFTVLYLAFLPHACHGEATLDFSNALLDEKSGKFCSMQKVIFPILSSFF